jgi:hypothetical protein
MLSKKIGYSFFVCTSHIHIMFLQHTLIAIQHYWHCTNQQVVDVESWCMMAHVRSWNCTMLRPESSEYISIWMICPLMICPSDVATLGIIFVYSGFVSKFYRTYHDIPSLVAAPLSQLAVYSTCATLPESFTIKLYLLGRPSRKSFDTSSSLMHAFHHFLQDMFTITPVHIYIHIYILYTYLFAHILQAHRHSWRSTCTRVPTHRYEYV